MIPLHLYYAALRTANRPPDGRAGRRYQGADPWEYETLDALTGIGGQPGRDTATVGRTHAARGDRGRIELLLRRLALFALRG